MDILEETPNKKHPAIRHKLHVAGEHSHSGKISRCHKRCHDHSSIKNDHQQDTNRLQTTTNKTLEYPCGPIQNVVKDDRQNATQNPFVLLFNRRFVHKRVISYAGRL